MKKITVIVPCYNEEQAIHYFYEEMERIAAQMPENTFEYVFVDDGSRDGTLRCMRELRKKDERVKYVSFSRNFGKEAAIYAGLTHATGDYVAIMDADLQDPPSLLPEMYRAVTKEGYDSAATRRVTRKGEPPIRSFFARCFYRMMNRISDVELMDGARDYRLMSRQYVDALLSLQEYNRFSKGLFGWVGFRTKWIEFENVERIAGETKWSFWKLFKYLLSLQEYNRFSKGLFGWVGFRTKWIEFENVERIAGETKWSFWKLFKYSLDGIVAFSSTPLYISSVLGAGMCGVAVLAILFIIIRQLLFGGSAYGWPSMACIVILIGGLQLLCIGILGLYLSKAYLEVKNRPVFIAKETATDEEEGAGEKLS